MSDRKIRISETFVSRQGEGLWTGEPSLFIRTSGCNLRCWFCDTPYASWHPEGDHRSLTDLLDMVAAAEVNDVVLTGGEPLLSKAIEPFCREVASLKKRLTIETAGTIQRDVSPNLLSLSPKLSTSVPDAQQNPAWSQRHDQRRLPIAVMRELIERAERTQVKFVVCEPTDFSEIDSVVQQLGVASDEVWIMPESTSEQQLDDAAKWLRPLAADRGYRYCDRMQIRWYGNRRGT